MIFQNLERDPMTSGCQICLDMVHCPSTGFSLGLSAKIVPPNANPASKQSAPRTCQVAGQGQLFDMCPAGVSMQTPPRHIMTMTQQGTIQYFQPLWGTSLRSNHRIGLPKTHSNGTGGVNIGDFTICRS